MPTARESLVVRCGRADLLGRSGTFEAASLLLRQLPFLRVCDYASRVSAVLHNSSASSPAVQIQLIRQLLGSKANGALRRLRRYDDRDAAAGRPPARRVVFDEQAALAAVRAAALDTSPDELHGESDAQLFGEAVLHLSDILEGQIAHPAAPSIGGSGDRWTWAYYFFVNGLARYDEWEVHSISRAFEVVFRRSSALRTSPYYLDIDLLLREAIGIGRRELCSIIFVLQSPYRGINAENVAGSTAAIDVRLLLEGGNVRFTREEYGAVLDHLSIDVAAFRSEVATTFSSRSLGYLDVARFYSTPFIRFGDVVVAPSVRLLIAKLSYGLHHTILFAIPARHRRRYLQLIGESFESYIGETLRRVATAQGTACLLEGDLRTATPSRSGRAESLADGVLFDDDTIFVWDAKSRTGPAAIYAGKDLAGFRNWYTDLIEEVASQCANTIRLQLAGVFEAIGLDRRPRRVVAAIVPYLPIVPYLILGEVTHELGDQIAQRLSITFERFVIVNPGEIEALEAVVTPSTTLQTIALDWAARAEFNTGSLHNYCLSRALPGYGDRHSPFLDERFREMTDEMSAVIAARGVAPPSAVAE